uniref:G protein-coupled receptor n=1 Tax=Pristionchus pacificus TaxID=54126 RepID=A0A8R1U7D0_PRIPA
MESDNIYDVKNIIITNVQFEVEDDVFAYIPYIPDQYKWSSQLAQVFHLLLSAATLVVDTIISIVIVQMRKEYSAKMKTRPEQGLLLSSVIALMMHIMNDLLLMSTSIFDNITLTYFITLTIAVSTTLPFWTMMTFAHTMRSTFFFVVFFCNYYLGVKAS